MRQSILRRRRRFSGFLFFAAFSWAGLGMGLDIKSGLIAKDFSSFLEQRLNTIFVDKDVKLSRIETSGFKNLALEDFSVSRKYGNLAPIFSVDKIIIKYNLLNLALRRFENLGGIYLVSPSLFFTPEQNVGFALPKGAAYSYLADASSSYLNKPLRFHILNGSITVLGREPILKNLEGAVAFYNSGLRFYNLKGAFLNCPVLVTGRVDNVMENPIIKLRLRAQDKYYAAACTFKSSGQKGEFSVYGAVRLLDKFDARFKGAVIISSGDTIEIKRMAVSVAGKVLCVINGEVNLSDKSSKFVIIPAGAATGAHMTVLGNINKENGLSIQTRLSHINFFGHDVLSDIGITTNLYKGADSEEFLKGALKTQNLIVDYKPFKELEASWVLKKKELFITNLELRDGYRLFGKIKLSRPYAVDLKLSINNTDLSDWLLFSNAVQQGSIYGLINGKIEIKGPLDMPLTNGRLNIKEGRIGDVRFDAMNFNLNGKGAILTVSDSRLLKDGGFLYIDGEIDLSKFGRRNLFEDLKITTDEKVIVWEGWDISKSTSEVQAKKALGEDFGVNFKTYMNTGNTTTGLEEQRKSEIGLDYKIKKDDSINVRMKEDSAFVGVEHKVKF